MHPRHIASVLIATAALLAAAASAHAAGSAVSSNWSGYVVTPRSGATAFRSVSGSWTVPQGTCTAGQDGYSSVWVGLGGNSDASQALEQIGTEFDCSPDGTPAYSAWYENVPGPSHDVRMAVSPGDQIDAAVTVRGRRVTLLLRNRTNPKTFKRTTTVGGVDVSSAEWIVEAPADCNDSGTQCTQLPISNFGTLAFSRASATTTRGYRGTIADPHWTATNITLAPDSGRPGRGPDSGHFVDVASAGGALASALVSDGSGFTVTYSAAT